MAHEFAHGFFGASQDHRMVEVVDKLLKINSSVNKSDLKDVRNGRKNKNDIAVTSKIRVHTNYEGQADMYALTLAAADSSIVEWEVAKHFAQTIRKAAYIDTYLKYEDKIRIVVEDSWTKGVTQATHDILHLSTGWLEAMDNARNGGNPYLLELTKNPIKLNLAIMVAMSHTSAALESATNDWKGFKATDYAKIVEIGSTEMLNFVESDKFKNIIDSIDASYGENPELQDLIRNKLVEVQSEKIENTHSLSSEVKNNSTIAKMKM
jgi:hypothetical protein